MILTDNDIKAIAQILDAKSGMDPELLTRCADFLHAGKYDEAVRNAFILLEERLRNAVNQEGMTGTQLANYAFNPTTGPLAKILGKNESEREGLREIFSGSFKLFRNPTAHGLVGYESSEGKSIIGLVNLLLKILDKIGELPPPGTFPKNVENALVDIEKAIGVAATSRLRTFLGRCLGMGLKTSPAAKQWLPFKRYALMKYDQWDKPRSHPLTLFYVCAHGKDKFLWFPINQYYRNVVDLDVVEIQKDLKSAGFQLFGKHQDYIADLRILNVEPFFNKVFDTIAEISKEIETRLENI